MSNTVLILGASGSGKSSSLRNLEPSSTFVISVLDKPLPFKGYKKHYKPIKGWDDLEGNYYASDDWIRIMKCIDMVNKLRLDITCLVIDDLQYILANEFMRRSHEKGYEKYSEMANHYWQVINSTNSCRDNLITFFLSHNEIDNSGHSKVKTIGKLLDEKITIEGLFSTVLHTQVVDGKYLFLTQNDGVHCCKSPIGMFEEPAIENDLSFVIERINEYFN